MRQGEKIGNVEIITGTRGGGSFGSPLGLFLPIYSISCYCPMNTNLLQMYYCVYLSVGGRNTDCIHSMAELQV